ncbi:CST complex subunit STN1 [Melia azedarach]|uniref:CST complex subunit STN1 n=1 Tax=Melia azedarach TaxID=155640 RepID=A0ACC1YVQ9_MELAZ|nr:CST complex subunit STN1 [Melia azedarach]
MPMDQSLLNTHVKLLAFDFLSLSPTADPTVFSRFGKLLSRAEIVGTITSRDFKPNKFVRFTIDDGTGCVPCILWLNHLRSPYFSRRDPASVRLIANAATEFAARIKVGVVARVRGRITSYRDEVQITVSDVVIEKDPNMEVLHWLDCLRLARKCYDVDVHKFK